ncbi:FIVAR domain-containing protein [Gardnerella sp. DNF00172]|uniref:peptidase n=1 Tax=Gardnerella sp. DNF00172 TaxID=2749043 RepID=UPI003BB1DDAA
MTKSNSRKHARKVTLDAAVNNAIEKAVDARKVAAFTVGAAGVLAGAAFAFGATPAMAADATSAAEPAKAPAVTAGENAGANKKDDSEVKVEAEEKASVDEKGKDAETGKSDKKDQTEANKEAGDKAENTNKQAEKKSENTVNTDGTEDKSTVVKSRGKRSLPDAQPTDEAATENQDRASNNDAKPSQIKPDTTDTTNTKIEINESNAETMPNVYGWGSSDNTYSVNGETHTVTFNFAKPKDGGAITNIAIFPAQNNGLNNDKSKRGAEYYSGDAKMHQSFSGNYTFKPNDDGSATLTMSDLFRDGNLNGGAEAYAANRSIFVYVTKDGTTTVYKTNAFRAATLVPPKTSGSVVLKYNQPLTDEAIHAALQAATNLPTERKDKKSVSDQLTAASTSKGVFTRENGKAVQVADTTDGKINVKSKDAYDKTTFDAINAKKAGDDKTYVVGAKTLNTYMVTDLGFKSGAIPLTVARYDDRIDKPIVEDPTNVSEDVKTEIKKKLARLNHVSEDKITFDSAGNAVINFDGVDPKDAPKIALRDLVLKKLEEKDISVPAADKATVVYNPLGYSKAELERIKQSILAANKDNKDLGLTSTDQITLSYIEGDTVTAGHKNQGISNGMAENTITVKIKTDKAYAEFTSDVKAGKLTRLVDIRKDYNVSWDKGKNKLDGRDSDEGLSWSNDSHTTIIYRYDPTAAKELKTDDIIKLLKATPKDQQAGLRDLTGGEALDHEDTNGKPRKSHMKYALKDDEPTGELSLGNMSGAYWIGNQKVSHSDEKLGDNQSISGSYSWDPEAGSVTVAGKKDKIYKARLFVQPYAMSYYKDVYLEKGRHPGNTAKAINVIFVPQTNHKTSNLKDSIEDHKTENVDGKDVPTQSKYYNASADKKDAYDKALAAAKETLKKVGTTADADLSEDLKAEVDNATIKLNKAHDALDGDDTKKEELKKSINANGKAADGSTAATPGTVTTDKYKNVTEPDFKKADGSDDTDRNNKATAAKDAYDKALEEAEKVNKDANATQKAVDDAKAKLDAARKELDKYSTNKDKLNAAIAEHGHVYEYTNDTLNTLTVDQKLEKADPTYKNSTENEREAYDNALEDAIRLSADPNASQKDVNKAIEDLKKAKDALDKNATDKAPLDAAVQKSFDNPKPDDKSKQSVFYKNAAAKKDTDPDAKKAVEDYDKALKKAKDVLADKNATKKDVEDAKKALEDAEKALHAEAYQTKTTDLAEAIADNVSGYLMPAYFNAFDLSQSKDPADVEKAKQAAKDFKAYNDAYHAAKDLLTEIRKPNSTVTQDQANKVKDKLVEARKAIDKYATDTSKISAALLHSLAITKSPAYLNASAGAAGSDEAKAKQAYDDALEKLKKAFNDEMPQDTVDGKPGSAAISTDNIPAKDGDTSSPDYLKNIQSHAKGQPLNRDVPKLLADLNKAVEDLNKFATKTDKLQESINKDTDTQKDPAYKNTKDPHKLGDNGQEDTSGYETVKQKAKDYDDALTEAKKLLTDPTATQAKVDEALKKLDDARKALETYKTDVSKLQESANKHGKEASGTEKATEGTVTSDAYRNASDPHFMKPDTADPTKLVEDAERNNAAKEAKKAYDKALSEAQELLSKHDNKDTPLDAKPTQKQIDDALTELNKKRKALDAYKTDTSKLDEEAKKSTADGATVADADFEATPEFKNADAKKKDDDSGNKVDNDEVDAYKKALKAARDLLSKKDATNLSERPTQKQVDEALDALKKAKKQIEDNYKTDTSKLEEAKKYANGDFKKTPEYKNATAIKDDNTNAKHEQAGKDLEGTNDNPGLTKLVDKITAKLQNASKLTQKEVDDALEALQKAMDKVTSDYKTDTKPLEKEVGDKDKDDKPVIPPFEESIPYKNALYKKQSETGNDATADTSATKKLQDYNDKFEAAKKIIDQVKNPDPNAKPEDRPTQKQVDEALDALQKAKKAIDDAFTTDAKDLKDESAKSTADGVTTVGKDDFENTPEFKNADSKKGKDGKENADVAAYKEALKKARTLLEKFGDDNKPKSDAKNIPTQKEVDEALQKLKEIKDKILADYKTSSTELQQEVDKSKDGDKDKRDDVFENTPAFKNATAKGDDASKQALKEYNEKLAAAKKILEKFDRTTGKPKDGATDVPTQKELYDALDALQAAKKKITDDYSTVKYDLRQEAGDDFTKSPEYQNAQAKGDDESKQALDEYKNALDEANSVLADPNATQAEVDAALKRLQDAKAKLKAGNSTDKSKLQDEADDDANFRKSPYFIIGNKADIEAYENALAEARSVLADPNATQAQVDAALKKLEDAKKRILDFLSHFGGSGNGTGDWNGYGFVNGHESYGALVDKTALQIEVNNAVETNANTAEAVAYRKALAEARSVLNDPNATQAQVDAALKKLAEAKAALLNSLSGASGHKIAKTGAATGLFAGFAVIFAGLGAAGVASRRRKHSKE